MFELFLTKDEQVEGGSSGEVVRLEDCCKGAKPLSTQGNNNLCDIKHKILWNGTSRVYKGSMAVRSWKAKSCFEVLVENLKG